MLVLGWVVPSGIIIREYPLQKQGLLLKIKYFFLLCERYPNMFSFATFPYLCVLISFRIVFLCLKI